MAQINITVSLEEHALRRLEQLAAREHGDIAALVQKYLSALVTKPAATAQAASAGEPDQAERQAKSAAGGGQRAAYGVNILAKSDTLRMVTITVPPGGCVPWHYHNNVTDTFFCLERPIVIETKAPDGRVELRPGQMYTVNPRQPHRVSCARGEQGSFALLQGVGIYDFVPL